MLTMIHMLWDQLGIIFPNLHRCWCYAGLDSGLTSYLSGHSDSPCLSYVPATACGPFCYIVLLVSFFFLLYAFCKLICSKI